MNDETADLKSLRDRFGDKGVRFEHGQGGMTRIEVTAGDGEAHIYPHGAHVTHYRSRGAVAPLLFMSDRSWFEPSKPIRGGIPVIFPWFGGRAGGPTAGDGGAAAADSPNHGFVRLRSWAVESVTRENDGRISLTLALRSDAETRAYWPFDFEARYRVTVGRTLTLTLDIRNTGEAPFLFEEALHTYFEVGDVKAAQVHGLDGTAYLDKTAAGGRAAQAGPIAFTGETDRVYLDTAAACTLEDPSLGRAIRVAKTGSRTTVVWNPWIAKAKAMPDFGDDEWPRMLCVETANAGGQAIRLTPGETHAMGVEIGVTAGAR